MSASYYISQFRPGDPVPGKFEWGVWSNVAGKQSVLIAKVVSQEAARSIADHLDFVGRLAFYFPGLVDGDEPVDGADLVDHIAQDFPVPPIT